MTARRANRVEDRFLAKVSPEPNSGCWLWTACVNHAGYGSFRTADRKTTLAHRVAWRMWRGPIPDGLNVLHRCDNPPCVNPDHLFLGTNADNVADKVRKHRQSRGPKHGRTISGARHRSRTRPETILRGAQIGNARLTEDVVRAIRRLSSEGLTQAAIARATGVTQSHVCNIINRKKWGHVP